MRQINGTSIKSFVDNELGHMVVGAAESLPLGVGSLPTTTLTFANGSTIVDRSTSIEYTNVGTATTPSWQLSNDPRALQYQEVDISAANIIGTAAGQLGHANGVILVPAAAAGFVNVLEKIVTSYTFGVAAYTAGGNVTGNIGGGGAALTGLVSAANSFGKASSNIIELNPLAVAGNALTSAQSINLVAASAFTNPGTATGTIKCHVWWKTVAI